MKQRSKQLKAIVKGKPSVNLPPVTMFSTTHTPVHIRVNSQSTKNMMPRVPSTSSLQVGKDLDVSPDYTLGAFNLRSLEPIGSSSTETR